MSVNIDAVAIASFGLVTIPVDDPTTPGVQVEVQIGNLETEGE